MSFIVTTRFTQDTWNENVEFRNRYQFSGCIYGSSKSLSPLIPEDASVFVVEMNNTANRIEGIGIIKNHIRSNLCYKIYTNGNYNRYIFKSNHRIDRSTIIEKNKNLAIILDTILFKGKSHQKRGAGMNILPPKLSRHELCENIDLQAEIKTLFLDILQHNSST
jgi:hypothetical protein